MSTISKKITHVKRRRVALKDIEKMLERKSEKIFSLNSPTGEINSYHLTLEQALDMVDTAIDEDGYHYSELEIFIAKEECESNENKPYCFENPVLDAENFLVDMHKARTREEMTEFLLSTEFKDDKVEFAFNTSGMSDEQFNQWFPKICNEYLMKKLKLL